MMLAIARELLTNAARHSGATAVSVALRRDGDGLALEVTDDGSGIAPGRRDEALAQGHIGLASVNERVRAAGGEFTLESKAGATRALARLPLSEAAPAEDPDAR